MKKIVLLMLVLFFLLSAVVVTSSAQERIVGVAVGDWFKYGEFSVSWCSNDPNATFPPPGGEQLEEMNETEWMLVSIQNISFQNIFPPPPLPYIFLQIVKHFKDGTEKTENGSVNIETGAGIMVYKVISANLDVNDTIYTGPPFSTQKIKEMVVRTYPDGERQTNHLNMTQKWNITRYMDSWTINGTGEAFVNYYWDRSTGILVEHSYEVIEQVGEYLTILSTSYRITESNVWTVPEFPTWTSTLLVLTAITAVIVIYKRRLLKTPIHSKRIGGQRCLS